MSITKTTKQTLQICKVHVYPPKYVIQSEANVVMTLAVPQRKREELPLTFPSQLPFSNPLFSHSYPPPSNSDHFPFRMFLVVLTLPLSTFHHFPPIMLQKDPNWYHCHPSVHPYPMNLFKYGSFIDTSLFTGCKTQVQILCPGIELFMTTLISLPSCVILLFTWVLSFIYGVSASLSCALYPPSIIAL